MTSYTKKIIFIVVSLIFFVGCNIDIKETNDTVEGSWASRDNIYDGCYAYYSFGKENDSNIGSYKMIKSKVLYGDVKEEDTGTYNVDYKARTIVLVSFSGLKSTLDFVIEDEKLYLEGNALHEPWKASRIELRKL